MSEEEEKKKLPAIGEGEQVPTFLANRHWFAIDTTGIYLDFAEPYRPPRWTLSHDGVKFANLGDLHVITGKSGHGKTSFMSSIMAAILNGNCGGIRYELSEMIPKPKILYIDTEMGKDDTIAIKNRVCNMAGLPYDKPNEQFKVARLRDIEKATDRWLFVLKLIYECKPNVVFLDGMLDIVDDYNKQEECGPIIRECMMMATEYDASVWCVLHENPTFEKMVGTLGSILLRKVTEAFAIRKHNQNKEKTNLSEFPNIYFTVDQLKARGRDVELWNFEVTPENGWGVVHELLGDAPAPIFKTNVTIEELKQWITDEQHKIDWPATRRAIYQYIFEEHGIEDEDEQKELMQMALNRKFFIEQTKKEMDEGQRNPRIKLNPTEIKPFGEVQQEIPF